MRVLVLGGTGLISQAIVRQLVAQGHEVHIYNRGRTAGELPLVAGRLLGERGAVAERRHEFESMSLDCVIDMVGYTKAEAQALVGAFSGIVPQVIYCSTTDIYVKGPGPYPLSEASPRGARPSFPYAMGKVESEELLEAEAGHGAFALTIIRPAQTYGGPGHGPNHPLGHRGYNLLRAVEGQTVILHGDASSLWCAAFAPDVAAAFVAAAGNTKAFGRDYIAAGNEVVTWRRYWEIAAEAFGGPPLRVLTVPTELLHRVFGAEADVLVENYQYNNVFDCTRAETELGFRYTVPLADGFYRVAAEYGERWLEEGRGEVGSKFAEDYERCVREWDLVTGQLVNR